jgi:2'-5' RNA ligase
MHRLFVACVPPPAIRRALLDIMGGVEGARWQVDPQLHLTLRFIGDVDHRAADSVALALATVRAPRFDIAVDGVGQFEKRGRVHTLWAGISPPDAATALHRKIDRALVVAGLAPEARAYRPHITLARLSRPVAAVLPYLQSAAGLSLPPFTVCEFALFESLPTAEGRVYRALDTYRLN